jgi:Fe-S-cluster containining protein
MSADYDCQQCGACCVDYFGAEGHVALYRGEPRRMRRLGLPVIEWHGQLLLGTRPHPGPGGDSVCAAFVGEVGVGCACAIHPDRPGECRRFRPGSLECRLARQEAGLTADSP